MLLRRRAVRRRLAVRRAQQADLVVALVRAVDVAQVVLVQVGVPLQLPRRLQRRSPFWARPQDGLTVGRLVVDGILNNDLFIFPAPEYRQGVLARAYAMVDSMVPFVPFPPNVEQGIANNQISLHADVHTGSGRIVAPRASATSRGSDQGTAGAAPAAAPAGGVSGSGSWICVTPVKNGLPSLSLTLRA